MAIQRRARRPPQCGCFSDVCLPRRRRAVSYTTV